MPLTFLCYFCMGSNLRWKMHSHSWPKDEYFQEMLANFQNVFGAAFTNGPGNATQGGADAVVGSKSRAEPMTRDVYEALRSKLNSTSNLSYGSVYEDSDLGFSSTHLAPNAHMLTEAVHDGLSYGCKDRHN
ncbi:hypothetical protein BC835DRAFT_1416304 [Cytidiella melzeri]|nr:hypothetical protein BC835DRAFT_1416304 [Cytidiella melzeri]